MHMKLDLARLQHRVVDVLITDVTKFFDVIAQDIHPIVGARVGLVRQTTSLPTPRGSPIPCPLALGSRALWHNSWGPPKGTIQGVHAAATAVLPFLRFMDIAYRAFTVEPFRFPGFMWVDDTIVLLERGDSRPIQGLLPDQRTYY